MTSPDRKDEPVAGLRQPEPDLAAFCLVPDRKDTPVAGLRLFVKGLQGLLAAAAVRTGGALALTLLVLACAATTPVPALAQSPWRAVVLPIQPEEGGEYDGLGLALMNVIENVLTLNPHLEETYLLRELQNVFPDAGQFHSHLTGRRPARQAIEAAPSAGIRSVVHGTLLSPYRVRLTVLNTVSGLSESDVLTIDANTGLIGFKRGLLRLLASQDLALPPEQEAKAFKPERSSFNALRLFGRSYGLYMMDAYFSPRSRMGLPVGEDAVRAAPSSYLALNMYAWQLYASGEHAMARDEFRKALAVDPDGVDALDGMMHCAYQLEGFEAAKPWALRKTRVRGADLGQALAQLNLMSGERALRADKMQLALNRFYTATVMDPSAPLPYTRLADAWMRAGEPAKAFSALDFGIKRQNVAAIVADMVSLKAGMARNAARGMMDQNKLPEARRYLNTALTTLRESPIPSRLGFILVVRDLARLDILQNDPKGAVQRLSAQRPKEGRASLGTEALLTLALSAEGQRDEALENARWCMAQVAERQRTGEPVQLSVLEDLAQSYKTLDRPEMASVLERQARETRELARAQQERREREVKAAR